MVGSAGHYKQLLSSRRYLLFRVTLRNARPRDVIARFLAMTFALAIVNSFFGRFMAGLALSGSDGIV